MTKQVQHGDRFNLPNTVAGRALLVHLMESHTHVGIAFKVTQTPVQSEGRTTVLLTLERIGRRPGEGAIAASMKERRR